MERFRNLSNITEQLTADRKQKTDLVESIKILFIKQSKNIPVHAAEFF